MPKIGKPPSRDRLVEILHYNPDTGEFRWKVDVGRYGRIKAGSLAGGLNAEGYRQIMIDGVMHRAPRLAVYYMMNVWPSCIVDHINKQRDDNRFINLRLADDHESSRNRKSKNQHGLKGVATKRNLFRARIMVDGKSIHIGYYRTKEEAHAAYLEKARELHGKFASD